MLTGMIHIFRFASWLKIKPGGVMAVGGQLNLMQFLHGLNNGVVRQ